MARLGGEEALAVEGAERPVRARGIDGEGRARRAARGSSRPGIEGQRRAL
jgi:hypothetical protein